MQSPRPPQSHACKCNVILAVTCHAGAVHICEDSRCAATDRAHIFMAELYSRRVSAQKILDSTSTDWRCHSKLTSAGGASLLGCPSLKRAENLLGPVHVHTRTSRAWHGVAGYCATAVMLAESALCLALDTPVRLRLRLASRQSKHTIRFILDGIDTCPKDAN